MKVDARTLSTGETVDTDICIVGAGPAGLVAAREFLGQGFRVSLLESGGIEADPGIQSLALEAAAAKGDFYPGAIHMRTRRFGGTSHQWNIDMSVDGSAVAQAMSSHATAALPEYSNEGQGDKGVRYVPLDRLDFEKRDWVPHSGWPITKADLDPYYERAQTVIKAGPYNYNVDDWTDEHAKPLPFTPERLTTQMFQFGPRDVYIKELRSQVEQSSNVTLYLYASVVALETDEAGQTVKRARLKHLDGREWFVSAKTFILALGGLEVPRLLLLSKQGQQQGLGNQHDVVGRYFMDHPLVRSGMLVPPNRQLINKLDIYDTRWVNGTMVVAKPVLTEKTMREEGLLNINMALFPRPAIYRYNPLRMVFPKGRRFRSPAVDAAQAIVRSLKAGQTPDKLPSKAWDMLTGLDDLLIYSWRKKPRVLHRYGLDNGGWSRVVDKEDRFGVYEVYHITEQAPDPDNRVVLGKERDALGSERLRIHWRWNDIDIRSTRRAQEIFAEELAKVGLGSLKIERDHDVPHVFLPSIHHHMGATRMHDDPKQGVVNADCRIHGVSNTYVASSSVFTTGGYANSTLTIVAIAIRVADEVKREMAAQR